jgi:hypothetical protein
MHGVAYNNNRNYFSAEPGKLCSKGNSFDFRTLMCNTVQTMVGRGRLCPPMAKPNPMEQSPS